MAPLCQHPHHCPGLNAPESCRPPSADVVSTIYTSLSTVFVLDFISAFPPTSSTLQVSEALSPDAHSMHCLPAGEERAGPGRRSAGGLRPHCSPHCWEDGLTGSPRARTPGVCSQGPNSPRSHLPEKPDALLPACLDFIRIQQKGHK